MPDPAPRPDPASRARSTRGARETLRRAAAPSPDELRRRARALLDAQFGSSPQAAAPADGFARGATGLLSEHTHYSDGFAMLAPLAQGAAVALRPAASGPSRAAFAEGRIRDLAPDAAAPETRVVAAVARALAPGPVEAAVVSTVPAACFDARLAALGVAAARAASRLAGASSSEGGAAEETAGWERVQACVAEGSSVPFSVAYVLAAAEGDPPHYVLVDTATGEHLPVAAPPTDELARGLFVIGSATPDREQSSAARPPAFHRERRRQAEDALRTLRASGSFDGLTAFRDLEHRDLERALNALSPRLQPIARHLLTENRRVQKLVRAARTGDWQFFGALLLMSHASRREDWWGAPQDADDDAADAAALHAVVEAAQNADEDGLYGACATGRGPCVLVVGRPAALPAFFRRTTGLLEERFDRTAEAMLL